MDYRLCLSGEIAATIVAPPPPATVVLVCVVIICVDRIRPRYSRSRCLRLIRRFRHDCVVFVVIVGLFKFGFSVVFFW